MVFVAAAVVLVVAAAAAEASSSLRRRSPPQPRLGSARSRRGALVTQPTRSTCLRLACRLGRRPTWVRRSGW